MATTNDLKNGLVLNIDGQLWSVVEFQHVKPGKGPAFVRTKLKNVLSGKVVDKTFNAGAKVETATSTSATCSTCTSDGDRLRLHGHVVLRPAARRRTPSSATPPSFMLENQDAIVAHARGRPAVRRAARLGRAR